ncbi:restriction endonuclease subunit S [Aeromonas jandaei]|uniref:restriction endonuclease subunit S n=1 Tax=Aeromonas jandaei TaxID=650 RepID=UPI003BA26798
MSEVVATVQQGLAGKYQPYPEYKDSGVEWLGPIPSSWSTCAVWMKFKLGRGRVISNEEIQDNQGPFPVYSSQTSNDGNMGGLDTFDFDGYYITWTTDGANAGTVFTRNGKFNCTNVCGTLQAQKPQVTDLRFYTYALSNATNWFVRHDINPKLMNNVMAAIRIPTLNVEDQRTIAAFLDYETARTDRLIALQQRLIELLKEKRQAVISHAVTKGLPSINGSNAPMKNSGVEWLGQVPEHWVVRKFGHVIDYLEGPGILAKDFHESGVPLLRIQNVKGPVVSSDFKTFLDPILADSKWNHFKVKCGDLIISCSASTGLVSEVDESTVGTIPYTGLIRLRARDSAITKDFIRLVVQSDLFYEQIERLQTGATIQHFGPAHLQQMFIAVPPLFEQIALIESVQTRLNEYDVLIAKAEQANSLMQERRTALISAAVTGKIDLRGWTPPTDSEVAA